jgi:hypothetical protein
LLATRATIFGTSSTGVVIAESNKDNDDKVGVISMKRNNDNGRRRNNSIVIK